MRKVIHIQDRGIVGTAASSLKSQLRYSSLQLSKVHSESSEKCVYGVINEGVFA
jgi:hypothetical protein